VKLNVKLNSNSPTGYKKTEKMKQKFFILGVLFSLMISENHLYAQVRHSHEIVLGNLQIKDRYNVGMVFNGVQLEYRYGALWTINKHEILYQPKLGFGAVFNRKILGLQLPKFAPVNLTWAIRFYEQNGHIIKAGANLITDYSYQLYPDLQTGHLFWSSEIGISPVMQYTYQWGSKRIGVYAQNSLLGFTSHKPEYNSYWFSLKAKEWFVEPHKNMKFGSYDKYKMLTRIHTYIHFCS